MRPVSKEKRRGEKTEVELETSLCCLHILTCHWFKPVRVESEPHLAWQAQLLVVESECGSVRQQDVSCHQVEILTRPVPHTRWPDPDLVALEGGDQGLVEGDPARHQVAQLGEAGAGEVEEPGDGVGVEPPTCLQLQGGRHVEVGEGDKGKDAKTITFLQDSAIVGDALNTWLPSARWQDSWPGDGEAIGVEVEVVDQGKVLPPLVERVGGHAGVASISHMAWLVRPHVPCVKQSDEKAIENGDLVDFLSHFYNFTLSDNNMRLIVWNSHPANPLSSSPQPSTWRVA